MRAGPPCWGSSGAPPNSYATHAWPSVTSSSARFVGEPPSHQAVRYAALLCTASSSVSTDTPFQLVSSFDHFVTQWMSVVIVSEGRATNSSHRHDSGSSTAPRIVKLHSSNGVWGVGPAE